MNTPLTPQQRLIAALRSLDITDAVASLTATDAEWLIMLTPAHLDAPVTLNKLFVECATVTLIASVLRDKLDAADKRWRQDAVEGQVPDEYAHEYAHGDAK